MPIVDAVLRERRHAAVWRERDCRLPDERAGQLKLGELEKFLQFGYTDGEQPVTYARYATGGFLFESSRGSKGQQIRAALRRPWPRTRSTSTNSPLSSTDEATASI